MAQYAFGKTIGKAVPVSEQRPKRRIMQAFKLDELSAVDRPAQVGAKVTIMKRHDPEAEVPVLARTEHRDVVVRKNEPAPSDGMTFEDEVQKIQDRTGCSRLDALRKAADRHPSLFEKYQEQGAVSSRPVEKKGPSEAEVQRRWEEYVERERKGGKVSRREAMQAAARLHSETLAAYRRS
jgi:hypothetical protein